MDSKKIIRQINTLFQEYLDLFPVTGIVGPRQVGKTTLTKEMANNQEFLYLDMERQADRAKLSQDAAYFLAQFKNQCVIIDEIQFMPELFNELRGIVDNDRRPGRFIILGSASPDLIRGSSETLAGRIGYLELSPFNLNEVEDLKKLWVRGGFPDSYLAPSDKASKLWRRNFIQTYIQRDLGLLGLNTDIKLMERFWQLLASTQGALLNAQQFGRAIDVDRKTITHYINFLEGAFIIRILQPWYKNLKKRLVKSPKVYIRDTGILHSLLGLDSYESILNHIIVGNSWEGFVIEQIINSYEEERQFWFYRTHQGAECDLLIEKNGEVLAAIEIKFGTSPSVSKGFHISMEDTGAKQGFIIGNGEETYKIEEKITVTNLNHFVKEFIPML
ncbi:MAG: ATP-binding protein [Flavobacteriaceae bacterium]|jgi:predicted AAA+ superfamily ATPase|nr:ATP-binding protein [Flavobacteriaceae bacterium]